MSTTRAEKVGGMDLEQLVGDARERELQPMPRRERVFALATVVAFLLGAGAVALVVPNNRPVEPLELAALVGLAAIARRVRFEVGTGEVCADQLAFIPLLVLAPLPLVAPLTALAYVLSRIPDMVGGPIHPERWLYSVGDALHAIGPVLVLAALAPGPLATGHLWVYALAIGAQILGGLLVVVPNDYLVHRTPLADTLKLSLDAYRIDVVLTPVALTIAAVAQRDLGALFAVVPLMWLLATFSKERRERYAAALELNQAYRGTVMVLSDVVEADDNYTASHCRSVVQLADAVALELGLDHTARQELEMAALLHDVGKIAIPDEILNKPSKLTDEEFELMKTHTLEGQALLDRVGGKLARVGRIVRSCHERWDGGGYPDGLEGEEIPEAARIVFCCDAYSAMTTDRPYRKAMSHEDAIAELRRNSGTQFEPRVVEAMERISLPEPDEADAPYADALRAVLSGSIDQPPALELASS